MGSVQFIRGTPRRTTLGGIVEALQTGVKSYQGAQDRTLERQKESLALAKTLADIGKTTRETEALNESPPTGYVRDSFSGKLYPNLYGNVNLPSGFTLAGGKVVRDPSVPRPLTEKEQFDLDQKKRQQEASSNFIKSQAQDMLATIGRVKSGSKYFGTFGGLPSFPGTERSNWEANVNKLLSGKIVQLLTDMKSASKTGATGFGQLSNRELGVLENASTALKKTLKPEHALYYLDEMEKIHQKIVGMKSYNSPEEADQSEPPGTVVMVQGRRYQV